MEQKSFFQKILHNNKYVYYALLVIICIAFATNYSSIFDTKLDMNGDNIYYYSLGKALAEGKGFTNTMPFVETPHTHFPPGYPVFIAGVMKFFPDSIDAIKIANGVLLLFSIILLFILLKKISGGVVVPFLTCFFCTLHSELLRYATIMMSETLYLFFTIAAILLVLNLNDKKLFTKSWITNSLLLLLLICVVNYIYFIRTMGTSIILAIIIYLGIVAVKEFFSYRKMRLEKNTNNQLVSVDKKIWINKALIFGVLLLSFAATRQAWDIRNKQVGKTDSDYIKDFKKKPNGQVMATWDDWSERAVRNFTTYTTKWVPASILEFEYDVRAKITSNDIFRGVLVIGLVIFGLIKLQMGGLLLFLYIGATMGVLLFWPEQYGGLRYFIAVIPFFIFLFFNGIKECVNLIAARILKHKNAPVIAASATVVCALLFLLPNYVKAIQPQQEMAKYKKWDSSIGGVPFAEYLEAIKWCSANLPDSTRVICRKPELFYIYSGGRKNIGFPQYGKPENLYQMLVDNKITHVVIDRWFRHAYVTLYPLIAEHYPEKFKLICKIGGTRSNEPPTLIFEFNPTWEANSQ